jgi:hypothetical protein
MNNQIPFAKTKQAGSALGALLLAALIQGAGNVNAQNVGITINPPVVVVPPAVVVQDDYQYYPSYGIYYNTYRHQYAYLNGNAWVWAPAPQGVSLQMLQASPSVHMDFHDSVEKHHKDVLQRYPKNWRPDAMHQDQKEERNNAGPDHDNNKQPGH